MNIVEIQVMNVRLLQQQQQQNPKDLKKPHQNKTIMKYA